MYYFTFYSTFYKAGSLSLDDLKEATKWGCLTKEEFKEITHEEYVE